MAAKTIHTPLTIVLFAAGLAAETVASAYVGHELLLNMGVVLATAIYFYTMDDIEKFIKKLLPKG